jgi:hypothetical protein
MEKIMYWGVQIKKILTERRTGEWKWSMKWDAEGSYRGTQRNPKYLPKPIWGLPEC